MTGEPHWLVAAADVHWARALAILGAGALLVVLVHAVERVARRRAIKRESRRAHGASALLHAARWLLQLAVVAATLTALLDELHPPSALVITFVAVVGLGTVLVAQASARDLVRGCTLLLDDQLRTGDYVELAGFAGVVEHVGPRSVRIRDDDGAVHFVRTGVIDTVTNRSFGRSWAVLDVPTGQLGLERSVQCLREAAAELRARPGNALRVLDDVEIAGLERWEPGGVQLRARIPVAPGQHASVRRELLEAYHRLLSKPTVA